MDAEPFPRDAEVPTGVWVERDLPVAGWRVAGLFLHRDGTDVLVELRLFPAPDDDDNDDFEDEDNERRLGEWSRTIEAVDPTSGGIAARHLRAVRLRSLDAFGSNVAEFLAGVEGQRARRAKRMAVKPERAGRAGRADIYYAAWAARYVEVLPQGSPIKRLAGQHELKESQIRDLIHKARVRGLLTRVPQGRAGGALTDKAIALLDESTKKPTKKEK